MRAPKGAPTEALASGQSMTMRGFPKDIDTGPHPVEVNALAGA
ncbi:MAG: hypothetical protein QE265_12905 [Rhodoferax sp.]|nr:hypothetical protein [Rhodoferax sp.]